MNTSDCCSSHIPEDIKGMMRQNFGINYNEKILFIRDTSFWNSRDQGLVLTDGGVYCIPDNDKPDEKIVLPWSVIQRVEYKDLVLYFWGYGDETDYCPIHISYFMKNEDNEKVTFFLKQDLEIITPGLNLILTNPYEISVQRKIGYE